MFKHHFTLAGGLVIAAAGLASAAQATTISGGESGASVAPSAIEPSAQQQQLDQLQRNVQQLFAAEGGWHLSAPSTPASTVASPQGFQWGDAGIGAAGATVLLGAGALGVGMTRRRRGAAIS
jgi:hypothetical protein